VQSVAVTAVDDAVGKGTDNGIISHSADSRDNDFDDEQISRVIAQIADNDGGGPSLSVTDVSVAEGNSGTRNLTFTVTSPSNSQTVTASWATANGTATAGRDYRAASGNLSFAAGEASRTVAVNISGDVLSEANETVILNLSIPTNATLDDAQAVATITNGDPKPALSVNDVSISEGNSGTKTLNVTMTLSAASNLTVTLNYATANGTASFSSYYNAASVTLT